MNPLLSIVIANYNYGRFLEEAIKSVIDQNMGDLVELIICDAASTDNSVEIIRKYANGLPPNTTFADWRIADAQSPQLALSRTAISWWCSEKDGGQSSAFNKGFMHARGRFLTWLNADDVLLPGTLCRFAKAVTKYPTCEWFVGGVMWLDSKMRLIRASRARPFSELRYRTGDLSTWGPSSFFTKRLLEAVGGVDERFQYAMDIDLWRRFAHWLKARYRPFCKYAWGFRFHESSKTSGYHFDSSGRADPTHPMWNQLRMERAWMEEHYKPTLRSNLLRRFCSLNLPSYLGGIWDTWRYSGRHYLELLRD